MLHKSSQLDNIKGFFLEKSILSRLVIINVAVFIFINIINVFLWLFAVDYQNTALDGVGLITWWLGVPSSLSALILKPWSLFTYMFVQENFLHLLFNMIVLFFGGKIFTEFLDERKLLSTYIWGGIAGALLFILAFNTFPIFNESVHLAMAIGSSASVLAILAAAATYQPNYYVNLILFGRLKLKWLALAFVLLDILSINRGNPGGHIAHIGGALWGFIYVRSILQSQSGSQFFDLAWLKKIPKWFYKKPKSNFKVYNSGTRPLNDEDYNKIKKERQQRIDHILEKISRSGYDSLTKEEKAILFKASNKEQ